GSDASKPQDLDPAVGLTSEGYRLSETQAQAILDLRLHRLTGLEQEKILKEYSDIIDKIKELLEIVSSSDKLMQVIKDELIIMRDQYGDERRTEILQSRLDLTLEDLITEEDVVVTLSHAGYAKAQPVDTYRAQKRGGKGKTATATKDEDFIDKLFVASTHDTILCFSSRGRVYWLKVYELPQAGRIARGKPIVNLLPLEKDERISAVLPIREYSDDRYILMATSSGTVKKTRLTDFSRPRSNGIIAVDLREDDRLIGVSVTDGTRDVMLFTSAGKAIRFDEGQVRAMGRTACGVRGIKLEKGQRVISLIVTRAEGTILTVTENGFGKRTPIDQYPVKGRGGMGVISIKTSERNGEQVGAVLVEEKDEVMLITDGGTLVRNRVSDISLMGRGTQGVTMIRLSNKERLIGLARVESLDIEDETEAGDAADDQSFTSEEGSD
ncbi:MAG TPA: DNA gyrase C-terminal beta-propeller domain-containing protein, partial [Gammaproteobacteria bacterium]|nr:DNA gyrase C-terminal beta-propeller domain-containing protein [Gammaproteobacteria bacterium]